MNKDVRDDLGICLRVFGFGSQVYFLPKNDENVCSRCCIGLDLRVICLGGCSFRYLGKVIKAVEMRCLVI